MTLKEDVAQVLGSLFGRETEKTIIEYYDDSRPEELLTACKEMMTRLLGPSATHRYYDKMIRKHPEIRRMVEGLK
jgi:hypothetical protein